MGQAAKAKDAGRLAKWREERAAAEMPEVRTVDVGGETVEMIGETVPTGLVPLPRFLRRFAGIE